MNMATKVPKTDLTELQQWLQSLLPSSFKLYQELQSHLRGKFPDLDFYVDRWPDPQAAAAVVNLAGEQWKCKEFYQDMVMGVAGVSAEALAVILKDKRVMDWSRPTYICGVADKLCGVVEMLAKEVGGTFHCEQNYLMRATEHSFKPATVPEGMTTSPIAEEDISIIDQTWTLFGSGSSADYVRDQIQHFPSVVLKSKSGHHVGHMFARSGGIIGALYVLPSFRGKGHAKVIVSQLAQKFFECGEDAYVIVSTNNQQSLHVHASVGFKVVPEVTLTLYTYLPREMSDNETALDQLQLSQLG